MHVRLHFLITQMKILWSQTLQAKLKFDNTQIILRSAQYATRIEGRATSLWLRFIAPTMPSCVVKGCKNNSQKQKSSDGMSFHRFPLEPDIRNKWIVIVRKNRQDSSWRPSRFCIICSEHFAEEDMYFTKQGRRCIKKEAKPTLKMLNCSSKPPSFASVEIKCLNESDKDEDDIPLSKGIVKREKALEDETRKVGQTLSIEFDSNGSAMEKPAKKEAEKKNIIKNKSDEDVKDNSDSEEPKQKHKKSSREKKRKKTDSDDDSYSDLDNTGEGRQVEILKRKLAKEKMLRASAKSKLKILQQKVRRLMRRNATLKRTVLQLKYNKTIENDENETIEIKLKDQDDTNSE